MEKAEIKQIADYLKDLEEGLVEIAERIGRPLTAVKQKAYSMGIKTREWRLWSANEIKLLKKLYPSENTQSTFWDPLKFSLNVLLAIGKKLCLFRRSYRDSRRSQRFGDRRAG